jgi:eukaryotic-like serine/threonine-protein kinase
VLDRYRLERPLGAGGFGTVWQATDERLGRAVAVKRIPLTRAGDTRRRGGRDPTGTLRARREALAAARLNHPAIVALYEAGADAEACYLVSELVRGQTLDALLADGALSDRGVAVIGIALCEALAHAHARGVIHRDVKPGNVIVPDEQTPADPPAKLTDFGVARLVGDDPLTHTGDVVGTLAYMAPEQAAGAPVGAPADVYALGLVLYEALAGVNPVRAASPAATARRVGQRLPALARLRRDLPPALTDVVQAAVALRPQERPSLREVADALAGTAEGLGDEPGTVDEGPLSGLAGRSHARLGAPPRMAAAAAAGALTAIAASSLGDEPPAAPLALGALAALAVAVAPRAGWAAAVLALAGWLGANGLPGTAAVVLLATLPTAVALRDSGASWSVPALAPALGTIGLAGAFVAAAGQAVTAWRRAALGALGAWWLLLAECWTGNRLLLGAPAPSAPSWEGSVTAALDEVLVPLATSGALAIAALWAVAALILPWIVRGRSLALDFVGASAWGGGLWSATDAVAEAIAPTGATHGPRGAALGAVAAGGAAVVARARRRTP